MAALCRAQLRSDSGDPATGQRLLVRAREALADRPSADELTGLLRAAEAELRAARGDLDSARDLLADAADEGADPVLAVTLAKVQLRAGDAAAAERTLPDWQAPAATAWPLPVRLDAGLLDAVLARARRGRASGGSDPGAGAGPGRPAGLPAGLHPRRTAGAGPAGRAPGRRHRALRAGQ